MQGNAKKAQKTAKLAAGPIGRFVSAHPTVKMLALAFLFVIGVMLIADGSRTQGGFFFAMAFSVSVVVAVELLFEVWTLRRGYIYFAMAFSVCVETLNLRIRRRPPRPVELRERYTRIPSE
jgi:predicted tellurium resistance membrane protein TerC